MRRLIVIAALVLSGCAQPSAGIDWFEYTRLEEALGRLRADRAPADAPVDADLLARNFRKIAFDREDDPFGAGEPQPEADKIIRKWVDPVTLSIAAAPPDASFLAPKLDAFAGRLREITGHPVQLTEDDDGDVSLLIIYGPDETMQAMARTDAIVQPDWSDKERAIAGWLAGTIELWRYAPSPCAGSVLIGDQPGYVGQIVFGVVLIRKEIPDLLLQACIEEELAQVMGTVNDDQHVRPSVFNDDQEFALLTDHDVELLRLLYDERIRPGMPPSEAMPIIREILSKR